MADTNELIDVCTDLIRLVEGVGCKDWRDQNGQRFKDTNEWVRAYVAINNARKESREQAVHPADAALADEVQVWVKDKIAQIEQGIHRQRSNGAYDVAKCLREDMKMLEALLAATLRARAVPDDVAKDTERLDFLIRNSARVCFSGDGEVCFIRIQDEDSHRGIGMRNCGDPHENPRMAIDAAILSSTEGRSNE